MRGRDNGYLRREERHSRIVSSSECILFISYVLINRLYLPAYVHVQLDKGGGAWVGGGGGGSRPLHQSFMRLYLQHSHEFIIQSHYRDVVSVKKKRYLLVTSLSLSPLGILCPLTLLDRVT